MAQPQQYRPPQAYASPHSTPSPMTPGSNQPFPPPKGSQMSPNTPTTPYHQPLHSPPVSVQNGAHSSYNPYAQQNANPYPLPQQQNLGPGQPQARNNPSPQPSHAQQVQFHQQAQQGQQQMMVQPQPTQAQGTMGPPASKPDDGRGPDLNEIADVMHGVGVDLRAEEAALAMSARRTYPYAGQPGHFDPQRNTMQANMPGGRDSFYGAGTFNQQPVTEQQLHEEATAKENKAKRMRNERLQFHNNEPFLWQSNVVNRINRAAQKCQTTIRTDGLYHPATSTKPNILQIVGPEGQERVATLTKEPLLTTNSPMVDVLALLSLAAREKVRIAIEDAMAMARSRKLTSSGIVPPEFQDIAVGQGKSKEAMGEPVPLIGASSPGGNARKRSHSLANELPTPVSDAGSDDVPKRAATISFSELLAQDMARRQAIEDKFEEERLAKRAKRETAKLINGTESPGRAGSVGGTPGPGTPGGPADSVAPDQSKMTKKEQKKKQEAEAISHAAQGTKNAVSMALGGGKKPAWMTAGKAGGGLAGTGFAKRKTPAATPAKKAMENAAQANGTPAAATTAKPKDQGGPREDREDGSGIEMRDMILVLKEGKERKTLSRAFGRLKG